MSHGQAIARGMMRFPKVVAFAAGLASGCGFAPLDLWPVTIIAFASLMWIVDGAPSLRAALARGYMFGLGHFIVGQIGRAHV